MKFVKNALNLGLIVSAAAVQNVWADSQQMITISEPPADQRAGSDVCGPFDPDCSRRLARLLSSIQIAPIRMEGGVRYGENGTNGAVKFSTEVVGMDVPVGDIHALMFDAIYLPDAGGFRLRFTLADSDVLFFCKDEDGKTHAPLAGLFAACKPEGWIGLGGKVSDIQWDAKTKRVMARWAEVNAVFNFLRNGNGLDYLKKRLNAYAGLSADTIWYGSTPGAPAGDDRHTLARANVGISGMLRSDNNHFEIRGLAGYRPNITDWNDYTIEARTQVLYHLLLNKSIMGDIGIDAQYQYNTVPAHSMGDFASDRERHSAYVGAIFGLTWGDTFSAARR
jgi:hypothetical protein